MVVGLLVGAIAAGIAVARGGSLDGIAETKFRWLSLLFVNLVIALGFEIVDLPGVTETQQLVLVLVTTTGVAMFLILNRRLPGTVLAGIGLLMNVLVTGLNGAMPVAQTAADIASIESRLDSGISHERMTEESRLSFLADWIPVPRVKMVLSPGDFVLAAGLAQLAYVRAMSAREDASS